MAGDYSTNEIGMHKVFQNDGDNKLTEILFMDNAQNIAKEKRCY